jgi:hypothetical protein
VGRDHHILVVDPRQPLLFELFAAERRRERLARGLGAIWSLPSNELRPDGLDLRRCGRPADPARGSWRADEVLDDAACQPRPALHRVEHTARLRYPARTSVERYQPRAARRWGMRVRLKASFDLSSFPADCQVIRWRSRGTG